MEKPHGKRRDDSSECRCLCGSLVARRVSEGVELKCRRCKRTLVVPLQPGPDPMASHTEVVS